MIRVRMIKTLAPVEIPNGTLGTWQREDFGRGMALVHWDNGYVIPMYRHEVEEAHETEVHDKDGERLEGRKA